MNEIWKDVDGYEGLYQVSSEGRIKCLPTLPNDTMDSYQKKLLKKEKIKTLSLTRYGYLAVTLYKFGVASRKHVHRFVATAFLENPQNKSQVNHKNGIKTDNRIENLEWCTASENMKHAYAIGIKKVSKNGLGRRNEKHVLSKKINQLSLDGEYIRTFPSISEVDRVFNKKRSTVSLCLSGRQKTAMNYKWEYV